METKAQPTCPTHGVSNRLAGPDGYAVERTIDAPGGYALRGAATAERRCLAVVYACPACEWAHVR